MTTTGCRAVATPVGNDIYYLRVELENAGAEPVEVATYEPFTAFSIAGTADGRPVMVHQPALDIPVNATTLRIEPGETVTLESPIQLRIAAGADAGNDGFIWTIPHDKAAVELRVQLALPAPLDGTCPLSFA